MVLLGKIQLKTLETWHVCEYPQTHVLAICAKDALTVHTLEMLDPLHDEFDVGKVDIGNADVP